MIRGTAIALLLLVAIELMGQSRIRSLDIEGRSMNSDVGESGADSALSDTPESLHGKCVAAEQRAEHQAGDMVPHRTWSWALDAEHSLQQLDELRQDLNTLKKCETTFEQSLSPVQLARFQVQVRAMGHLSQHLQSDMQSLEEELRKGHPRRWHVAHDALDMQKEIERWRRLHEKLWSVLDRQRSVERNNG